jgi:hypothetical protein
MPDIAMCSSETCSKKETCRRNPASGTVPNGQWQSWSMFAPEDDCGYYMPVRAVPKSTVKKTKKPKAVKPQMVCKLELTKEQSAVVERAMELYCRLHLGQFWAIQEIIFPTQYAWDKRERFERVGKELYMPELGLNSYHGIGSPAIDESARTAWGIQKTLRYCRSWANANKHPREGRSWSSEDGQHGCNFDEPDMPNYGHLPKCEYVSASMKVSWPWK